MKRNSLKRERVTIEKMMHIYCRSHHEYQGRLCEKCQAQLEYAFKRIELCPFKEKKPTCKNCNIHCYKPDMVKATRVVMRYSGPRMFLYHPLLAIMHLVDLLLY